MHRHRRPVGLSAGLAGLALLVMLIPSATASGPRLLGIDLLAPVGHADAYSTPHQTELVVASPGVLANDSDPEGSPISTQFVSGPTHGTLNLAANGGFRYQPASGFSGRDTFKYKPSDGYAHLIPAGTVTVTITVAAPIPTPTPAPTPAPTPTPSPSPKPTSTPTPTPTPSPAPTPSPVPTPRPTPRPTATLPLPTLPLPTQPIPTLAIPSPIPTAVPTSAPAATSQPASTPGPPGGAGPTPGSSSQPRPSPTASAAIVAAGGGVAGGGGPPAAGLDLAPTILTPQRSEDGSLSLTSFGDLGVGIEWVVPSVLITVPGFLLIVIGLAQLFGGFVWLPLARRWLRGDGRRAVPAGLDGSRR